MVIRDFPASRLLSAAYSLSPKVFPSEHMLVPVWCCVPTESFKCTQGIGTATYTLMTLSWIQLTSPTKTLILATSGQIVILDHMFFCKGQTQPNTLRKVERKNICGGQITLTFIHEMLISWGQTFHFSEYLTSLFINSPILHQSTPTCHGVRQLLSTIGWLDPQGVGRHRLPVPEHVILASLKEYKYSLTFRRVDSPLRSQAASPPPEGSPGPAPAPAEPASPPSADK